MDMQCQYRSKRCPNVRSVKISGELHRFCIFHRWRANATQRRWVQRKQTGDAEPTDSDASAVESPASTGTPKRAQREMETPFIKLENEPEPPAPKRRRSDATKKTKSPRARTGPALETATTSQVQLPERLVAPVALPPLATVGHMDGFAPSVPMTYPVLSDEDFVIFRHLVLDTEDHALAASKQMPVPAVDVGCCWWDVNYRKAVDDQPSFLV